MIFRAQRSTTCRYFPGTFSLRVCISTDTNMERKLSTNIWTEVCLHVHSGEMSLNDRTTICINFIGKTFIYVQRCEYSNKSRIVKCTWGAEKGEKYAWSRESCFIPTCTRSPLVSGQLRRAVLQGLGCCDGAGVAREVVSTLNTFWPGASLLGGVGLQSWDAN